MTLVVPYAAGGGTDNVARGLARGMSEKLGVSESMKSRLASEGASSYTGTPAAFGAKLGSEPGMWKELAKASKLKETY
jgi:tripartite-type tricarboxylate transporter receptor subunit TctC